MKKNKKRTPGKTRRTMLSQEQQQVVTKLVKLVDNKVYL